jgi:Protein of unknown function (DUF3300)
MNGLNRTKLMGGLLALAGAMLINTAPAVAQDYPTAPGAYAPAGQLDSLVSRIALYPDPLLAQIFAAAAFPDQVAAAAQGAPGPFDPSVEALRQYPTVLQMMASDPGWTQALGQAVMQDEGAVMDTIQNLRREAQQYGYLQSTSQMQVVDDGGYIDIMPVGAYMYVPVYDPYIVFARPRPGFFVGGAIRFGGGYHWVNGYNRFDWGRHQVFVNRRAWTPPMRPVYSTPQQRPFQPRRFEDNRPSFGHANREWNRNLTAPTVQAPVVQAPAQRNMVPQQPRREFGRPMEQRNFTAPAPAQQRNFTPPAQMQQRNFAPPAQMQQRNFGPPAQMQQRNFTPRPMEQHNFTPQPRNNGGFQHGGEGRGHGR